MADLPVSYLFHAVTVRTRTGSGAAGPVFAAPVSVRCNRNATQKRVTTSAGTQVVSSAVLLTTFEGCDGVDPLDLFAEGSEVTWTGNGSGIVGDVGRADDGGSGAWQHVQVVIV